MDNSKSIEQTTPKYDSSEFIKVSLTKARNMIKKNKRATPATAWLDMLFMANEESHKYVIMGNEYQANRGQIIANVVELSIRWHWGVAHVLVFLCMLRGHGLIKVNNVSIYGAADVITINILNIEKLICDGKEKGGQNE